MNTKQTVDDKSNQTYNPLAWGILFFSMWLILVPMQETAKTPAWLPTLFLILSIVLLASIFIKLLLKMFFKAEIIDNIIKIFTNSITPIVFELTIAGFIIGWLQGSTGLQGSNFTIAMILGFIWLLIYTMVGISHINGWKLRYLGFILYTIIAIIITVTSGFMQSWPLWLTFIFVLLGTIKPKWFNWIALI